MLDWDKLPRPILALAPMAGYSDSAFRLIIKEICPSVVCFTEFTNVDGILHGNRTTMRQISLNAEKERPIVVQIFGKNPASFQKAAKIVTELGADGIDINMGCPARKIISSDHGSALLKNPTLAAEIVEATVKATPLPVSVKMRIGINSYDRDYFLKFGETLQKAGAKLLTVHGRTAKQMYSGSADWQPIYELKKILKIPVIGNGDIKSGADAVEKLKNLDGVMVGRGSMGNPWIFTEIAAALDKKHTEPPTLEEKLALIKRHIDLSCQFKDEKWGILEMRKQLVCYIRGVPGASAVRQKLVTALSRDEVFSILEEFLLKIKSSQ